jgi:hypothetical protein
VILSDVETEQIRPGDPGFPERMAECAGLGNRAGEGAVGVRPIFG